MRNAPCACGSGKRYKACCGRLPEAAPGSVSATVALLPFLQREEFTELEGRCVEALKRGSEDGPTWQLLAVALQRQGRSALHAAEQAARYLPQDAVAQLTWGNELARAGRNREACEAYGKALLQRSEFCEALANLGQAHYELEQFQESADSCERALLGNPEFVQAHHTRARALLKLHRFEEALSHLRSAIGLDPRHTGALMDLAMALRSVGRLDEAALNLQAVLAQQPDCVAAHAEIASVFRLQRGLQACAWHCEAALSVEAESFAALTVRAELHADQGEFPQAEALHRRVLAKHPDRIENLAALAHLRRMTPQDADWLRAAQQLLTENWPARRERVLQYALGKYYDDVGEFDAAFSHYRRANVMSVQCGPPHDAAALERIVERIIGCQGRRWIEGRRASQASHRPVFIVGMPRSGTTLAEQILAAHPAVFGAGELSFWAAQCASAYAQEDATQGLLAFEAARVARLGADYLQVLQGLSADRRRVADKFPANFFFLGLIHAALPQARIIHLQREPRDTCLSIYFQQFEAANTYANDLQHIAHYYMNYRRLMRHWRGVLPSHTLLQVPYEGLVQATAAWSRRMLDFIELPWDAACLDFHRASPSVVTASRWQVRQGIMKSSLQRWRNYAQYLGPLASLRGE